MERGEDEQQLQLAWPGHRYVGGKVGFTLFRPQFILPLPLLIAQAPTGAPPLHMDPAPGALAQALHFDLPERRGFLGQSHHRLYTAITANDNRSRCFLKCKELYPHRIIDPSQLPSRSGLPYAHFTDEEPETQKREGTCQITGQLRQDLKTRSSESRPSPLPSLPLEGKEVLVLRAA